MKEPAPCLVYYHGGGFIFGGAGYHYKLAKQYAMDLPCKVVFVQYRFAPKNPHPTPSEDCYAALRWTFENAEQLNVDKTKIAVGGDSAGGALAAAVCQMARDRGTDKPLFQLLFYPVTDCRMQTESCKEYTYTPMWNAKLSVTMWRGYIQDENAPDIAYASPMEAKSFDDLPGAYVETAEFDRLHDEGMAYAQALRGAGVAVELYETKGTMHGFDIVEKRRQQGIGFGTNQVYEKVFSVGGKICMLFAIDYNDNRVHIDETHSNQEYYCPYCGAPLTIKKGEIRQHHFAHKQNHLCSDTWERIKGQSLFRNEQRREHFEIAKQKVPKCY
ncbi:MAG: competence protein CoiA family protein [Eubacteriales bacterium]